MTDRLALSRPAEILLVEDNDDDVELMRIGFAKSRLLGKRPVISRGAQNRLPALWLKLERYELRVASVLASEAGVRELGSGGDASSKRGVT